MSNRASMFLAVLLVASVAARAGAQPAEPRLTPFAYLVGHCWRGTFPDSAANATDEHCYEWMYNGRLLRDRHTVLSAKPPYHGETIFAVDPSGAGVIYRYFNSAGQVIDGSGEVHGDTLIFREVVVGSTSPSAIRTTMLRAGRDAYDIEVQQETAGVWKPLWRMRLQRR